MLAAYLQLLTISTIRDPSAYICFTHIPLLSTFDRTPLNCIIIAHPLATLKCRHKDGSTSVLGAKHTPPPNHTPSLHLCVYVFVTNVVQHNLFPLNHYHHQPPVYLLSYIPYALLNPHTTGRFRQKSCDQLTTQPNATRVLDIPTIPNHPTPQPSSTTQPHEIR